MTVLLKTLQVILALSLLVFIHELGHYFFAKLFRIKVDKFYLFFDVGGFRLFSTKHNKLLGRIFPKLKELDTDYGIGWLPLGGYCKISGMVDESMDTDALAEEPKPYEFRTHPAWQRLLVMFGGVLFNFIFAILVYIGLLFCNGTSYIANKGNKIYTNALSEQMGFRTGDEILAFDDYVPENFGTLAADLARRSPLTAKVLRDNDTVTLYMDRSLVGEVINTPELFALAVPFVVDTLLPSSPNADAGLRHMDSIISIEGHPTPFVQDSRALLQNYRNSTVTALVVRRSNEGRAECCADTLAIQLKVDSLGLLGIYPSLPGICRKEYNFAEAIPAGIKLTFSNIGGYLQDLKLVFTPSTGAYKSVGSFISIGQVFPSSWDWTQFFSIVAMLSIMLGVMNLIPIPGLDGGHIVITLYEMIARRKPSERFLIVVQMIGMVLIVLLMMLALGNDITKLIK